MSNVLFIGLGHLGQYFAEVVPSDWQLAGTYRSPIEEHLFKNFKLYHFDSKTTTSFPFSKKYDYVVWSLPPFDSYVELLRSANEYFESSTKWIYIGSTGVYASGDITESSPLSRATPRQDRLTSIETSMDGFERDVSIIRPSGLFDETRNPSRWFQAGSEITSSENRVNFVYTKDVARFIVHLVEHNIEPTDFNLSATTHPTKRELYSELIDKEEWSNITLDGKNEKQKIIDNTRSKSIGFNYLIDHDLLDILK